MSFFNKLNRKNNGLSYLSGRYRMISKLGQGGMGSVWLAEDTKLGNRKIAIKTLPNIFAKDDDEFLRIKKEALISLQLSHENICSVRAFEQDENGAAYIVMDYIEGVSLDTYVRQHGRLTEKDSLALLLPIANAIDYAHAKGIVHRDIKPSNIMLDRDGRPYILDFGIAKSIEEVAVKRRCTISGTVVYMSPEQLRGLPPTATQDIYSFAATVYQCVTGSLPFSGENLFDAILRTKPDPISGDFSFSRNVMKGLDKNPTKRPHCCAEVLSSSIVAGDIPLLKPDDVGNSPGEKRLIELPGNVDMVLVWCPGGDFRIGDMWATGPQVDGTVAVRNIRLNHGFWIGETEVTQEQWKVVCRSDPSVFKGADRPVENISWNDTQQFFAFLNKIIPQSKMRFSLPTEAQWERAARAGTKTVFPWGDAMSGNESNCDGTNPYPGGSARGPFLAQTTSVFRYAPNAWGVYDACGNVGEFVRDNFDYARSSDSDKFKGKIFVDYEGPTSGVDGKILGKGGSWRSWGLYCSPSARGGARKDEHGHTVGFRVGYSFPMIPQIIDVECDITPKERVMSLLAARISLGLHPRLEDSVALCERFGVDRNRAQALLTQASQLNAMYGAKCEPEWNEIYRGGYFAGCYRCFLFKGFEKADPDSNNQIAETSIERTSKPIKPYTHVCIRRCPKLNSANEKFSCQKFDFDGCVFGLVFIIVWLFH